MEPILQRAESASILLEKVRPLPTLVLPTLRRGERGAPLYLFPGAGADLHELSALVSSMACPNTIIGVEYTACIPAEAESLTVKLFADRCADEIRAAQPSGPYLLAGYSFGGLVAVEVARLFQEAGLEVGLLVMIDTIYDRRFWPVGVFLKSQGRRAFWHLKKLASRAPRAALAEIGLRARNFMRRIRERLTQSVRFNVAASGKGASLEEQCLAAAALYQPSPYPGRITFISAELDDDFACSPMLLWRKYCGFVSGTVIPGSHLATVREPESIALLASALDLCLEETIISAAQPEQLRVLVINAFPWPSAAHAARSFHNAGAAIDVLCCKGHPLTQLPFVRARHAYSTLRPLAALRAAIIGSQAELLIPCDDQVTLQLHQLYESAELGDPLRPLIVRSLGNPGNFRLLYSRASIARLARDLDIPCPETGAVRDLAALQHKVKVFGLPAVLKIDGSSGGRGVAIVNTAAEAERAFARLLVWPGFPRALKHLLVNRNATLLRRILAGRQNKLSLQKYIDGRPANAAVACWQGKFLAAVLVEVLKSDGPTGPATVVRLITHRGMTTAIDRMVSQLKLSGLCGFDFIIRADDESAQFIELNPRATPTCHLITAEGRSLSADLCAQLRGDASAPASRTPTLEPIALSPRNHRADI
jgi:thioesterase domain-containing protein